MLSIKNAADFGRLIRARRKAAGLSQQALADQVGISRQSVIALEAGKGSFELGAALRCLRALGVTLSVAEPATATGQVAATGIARHQATRQPAAPKAGAGLRSPLDAHVARFRKPSEATQASIKKSSSPKKRRKP